MCLLESPAVAQEQLHDKCELERLFPRVCQHVPPVWVSSYARVATGCLKKKLPFVKIGHGKYYSWQWEIHMKLLQIQVKHQALLWQQVNVWVHVMNLSQIALLFFKLGVLPKIVIPEQGCLQGRNSVSLSDPFLQWSSTGGGVPKTFCLGSW